MHRSKIAVIVVDVPEGERSAAEQFWSLLTGRSIRPSTKYPEYSVLEPSHEIGLLIQAIGGEARYHLDVHTDDLEAECRRVQSLGAKEISRHDNWVVFTTPGDPLLCVVGVPPHHESLNGALEFDS